MPFSTSFSVSLKAPNDGHASITLIDAAGRTIERQGLGVSSGYYYVIEFNNTATLATGVYFVRYDDGKTKKTVSVVRQ